MNKKRQLTFAVALILAALVVFAASGFTLQAAAAPKRVPIEPKSMPVQEHEDDRPRRLRRDTGPSDLEGPEGGPGDGDDPAAIAAVPATMIEGGSRFEC